MKTTRSTSTQKLALGGLLIALCVVMMLLGALIGIGTYAAPMLAGLMLLPAGELYGKKYHALLWLCASVLNLLLIPDAEAALMFLCPFGCYPLLYAGFARLPRGLRILAKSAFFLAAVLLVEAALLLFVPPEVMPLWMTLLLLVLGTLLFFLYDRLLPMAQRNLTQRLRRILRI